MKKRRAIDSRSAFFFQTNNQNPNSVFNLNFLLSIL